MLEIEISADQESKLHSILDRGFEVFNLKPDNYESHQSSVKHSQSQSITESVFKSELEKLQDKIEELEDRVKPHKNTKETPRFIEQIKRPELTDISSDDDYSYTRKPKNIKKPRNLKPKINDLQVKLKAQKEKNDNLLKSNSVLRSDLISCKSLKSKLQNLKEDLLLLTESYERSETIRKKQKEVIMSLKERLMQSQKSSAHSSPYQTKHKGKIIKTSNMNY